MIGNNLSRSYKRGLENMIGKRWLRGETLIKVTSRVPHETSEFFAHITW